jgi:hypothetical protein
LIAGEAGSGSADSRWHQVLRSILRRLGADPERPPEGKSRWPSARQGFLWDLAPGKVAPGQDGVVPPGDQVAPWLDDIRSRATGEQLQRIVEVEHERHQAARHAAETAEAKASRLLTPVIALLTGAVALVALQFNVASRATTVQGMAVLFLFSIPAVLAVWFLFVAATRALDADTRVGVYKRFVPKSLADLTPERRAREAHLAANRASWNSRQKLTRLMDARAAVSRAVLFLVLALLLYGGTTLFTSFAALQPSSPQVPSPQDRTATIPAPSHSPSPSVSHPAPTPTPTMSGSPNPTSRSRA